jgi:hypothetical protein
MGWKSADFQRRLPDEYSALVERRDRNTAHTRSVCRNRASTRVGRRPPDYFAGSNSGFSEGCVPVCWNRAICKDTGPHNLGYHAFREREQAEREASTYWSSTVIGSVAMWGEVIEHEQGWRSEYAAVRSITEITGERSLSSKQCLLLGLREKYGCAVVTEL